MMQLRPWLVMTFGLLAWFAPRRAAAECEVLCPYVCCNLGYTCSADGFSCIPSGGGGGGGSCMSNQETCPSGSCCPENYSCCPGGGCCEPGYRCGDIPGSCVFDETAELPPCGDEYPVECGNGNCCGVSFPVCCPFTCCPLGTTCSANGFSCIGEPSTTCEADKQLTLVECEGEKAYCECASECSDDSECATGCCRGGVCSHPCLCDDTPGKSAVTANVDPTRCPTPNFADSKTGGLGRGGCDAGGHSTRSALLVALALVLVRTRRRARQG